MFVPPRTLVPQPGPRKGPLIDHLKSRSTLSVVPTTITTTLVHACCWNSNPHQPSPGDEDKYSELDQCMLIICYLFSRDEFGADLSRVLSKFEIKQDNDVLHRMVTEIKNSPFKIYTESWGKRIFALEVSMSWKHRHDSRQEFRGNLSWRWNCKE